ncbi:invertebrate-type lysozyme 3-like [Condylostylus longicornis]|uniref:invertebrate-type lysozyme 3-like n=1 Tax=Condylostylus longicornis TaxID=2530218 RepID=UPI00244E16E7|nr:invertebrate-type lysozyme 3-like [Condylostylus longicornis]
MNFKLNIISNLCLIAIITIAGFSLFVKGDVSHLPLSTRSEPPVTEVCLGCICEAISGCNRTLTCNGDTCGLFRITWPYWADSGKPTLNGEPETSETAYPNCVNDPFCAARTIQNYMAKYGQDCNEDGEINCYDHAAIHKLGAYGCKGDFSGVYFKKLNECLQQVQAITG